MNCGDLSQKSLLNTVSEADKTGINAEQTKWDGTVKGLKCYIQLFKTVPRGYGVPSQDSLVTFYQNGKKIHN